MAKSFHLTVARVGENLFSGEAIALHAPAEEGQLTILANHEAYVAPLTVGTLRIDAVDGEVHSIELLKSGILEVSGNQATVLL